MTGSEISWMRHMKPSETVTWPPSFLSAIFGDAEGQSSASVLPFQHNKGHWISVLVMRLVDFGGFSCIPFANYDVGNYLLITAQDSSAFYIESVSCPNQHVILIFNSAEVFFIKCPGIWIKWPSKVNMAPMVLPLWAFDNSTVPSSSYLDMQWCLAVRVGRQMTKVLSPSWRCCEMEGSRIDRIGKRKTSKIA